MAKVRNRYSELVEPGKFVLKEETLDIADDQVLVKVQMCGICKYDLAYYRGILGTFPGKLGHEPTGIVEQVGRDVTQFRPGDRVTGVYTKQPFQKGFATYAVGYEQ